VVSKLTNDHNALKKSIEDIEKPFGGTNFWMLCDLSWNMSWGNPELRIAAAPVVVMTDGVDNALPGVYGDGSATSFEDLLKIVQHSDAIVLPIYLDTEHEQDKHSNLKEAYALAAARTRHAGG